MTLDDTLWDLLDAVHLGTTFDKYKLPPILFPIIIIAIVAVVILLLMSGGGGVDPCGDGICDSLAGETEVTCSKDCNKTTTVTPPQTGKTIKVYVTGGINCDTISVTLKDSGGGTVDGPKQASNRAITFSSVTEAKVYAEVSAPQSTKATVRSTEISTTSQDTIRVSLEEDYCTSEKKYGSIRVILDDAQTGSPVDANVMLFESDGSTKAGPRLFTGEGLFTNLESEEYYYLTASASGYDDYYGENDKILLQGTVEKKKTIHMVRTVVPGDTKGKLLVCVSGKSGPCPASGEITVYGIENEKVVTGKISDCPLGKGGTAHQRCFEFTTLDVGKQYLAQVTRAPSGCSISEKEGPFLIKKDDKEVVTIKLDCDNVGKIRAIVYTKNDSKVVTDNVTVNLHLENGTKLLTFNMSSNGNYTEAVELPADTEVYIRVRNVPDGYEPKTTKDYEIEENETITVNITLNPPPPPKPPLSIIGADMPTQIFEKGQNFIVTADAVKLEGKVLTSSSKVKVVCDSSWNKKVTATYNETWSCNMTAPTKLGSKTVTIKATHPDAEPDTKSFNVYVVNESLGGLLNIELNSTPATSPAKLLFKIFYTNETFSELPVPSLQGSNLTLIYKETGGVVREEKLTGKNGLFGATFPLPFKGVYTYRLNVSTVIDGVHYWQLDDGEFGLLAGGSVSLNCNVDPWIAAPSKETDALVNVSATMTFYGKPLPDQEIIVTVIGRGDEESTPMSWSENASKYLATVATLDSECIYTINCTSAVDPSVTDQVELYVVDPETLGTDPQECKLDQPTACTSIGHARDCYSYLLLNPALQQSSVGDLRTCVDRALPECEETQPQVPDCKHSVAFMVRARNSTGHYDTPMLYYQLAGTGAGREHTLTPGSDYTSPADSATSYKLINMHLPGGQPAPTSETGTSEVESFNTISTSIEINSSTGEVTVTMFCALKCGGRGDLNNDADVNELDLAIMRAITDTIFVLGEPPYSDWPPSCVDVVGDGVVTRDDYLCLDAMAAADATAINSFCVDVVSCRANMESKSAYGPYEVCADSTTTTYIDNNCDGQTDRDTYDEATKTLYDFDAPSLKSLCGTATWCDEETPCEMVRTIENGDYDFTLESEVKRCASLQAATTDKYAWYNQTQWRCNSGKFGTWLRCGTKSYICDSNTSTWMGQGDNAGGTFPPALP